MTLAVCAFAFAGGLTIGFLAGAFLMVREAMRELELRERVWRRYGAPR